MSERLRSWILASQGSRALEAFDARERLTRLQEGLEALGLAGEMSWVEVDAVLSRWEVYVQQLERR